MTNSPVIDKHSSIIIPQSSVNFAWLEITLNCQLTCNHCYSTSSPGLGHGQISAAKWKQIMDELRIKGIQQVQFIGGEPTTHPQFCELVKYAADQGFSIEVYTNLVSITQQMWDSFKQHDVSIATSFYSLDPHIHDAITNLDGVHQKTLANIRKAIALGLNLRVGIVQLTDDQDISSTEIFLQELGIDPSHISTDRVRGIGRGHNLSKEDTTSALCGKCTSGQCVITSDGTVFPCIMSRSFPVGNVLEQTIDEILDGETFKTTSDTLNAVFASRDYSKNCPPVGGSPCQPHCMPACGPPCPPRHEF